VGWASNLRGVVVEEQAPFVGLRLLRPQHEVSLVPRFHVLGLLEQPAGFGAIRLHLPPAGDTVLAERKAQA
jgi:hypothetical protein